MFIDDRSVQRALKVSPDGNYGAVSKTAARKFLVNLTTPKGVRYVVAWSNDRVRIAVEQVMMTRAGIDVGTPDGLAGPRTQIGKEKWQDYITFDRVSPNPSAGVAASSKWPRHKDALDFYGEPGTNHTTIVPPYDVYYGTIKVKKMTLNERCAESGLRILEAVKAEYGDERIHDLGLDRYGGSFNNRPMRNSTTISTHAFAAAWDWDPARNQLRQNHRTAQFARPEYAGFIDAHEQQGWLSLGRARDMDWMHFQA
ncbi:MAG: hypothetical protein H0T60_06810, partial [Acidobacteria bacterium]|nr:hypothetical protein [Acidobacteriota bacterium]